MQESELEYSNLSQLLSPYLRKKYLKLLGSDQEVRIDYKGEKKARKRELEMRTRNEMPQM